MTEHALCTLSGGFDSAAAMLWALERWPTEAVFITHGQAGERQERRAVNYLTTTCPAIARHPNFLGLRGVTADLFLRPPGDEWIPYRNLAIAAAMANIAGATGAQTIVFGTRREQHHADDPTSYLDSTIGFYRALEMLLARFTELQHKPIPTFSLPLVGVNKKSVLERLCANGVDLRKLWNCARPDGALEPCEECAGCATTQPLVAMLTRSAAVEDATGCATV